MRPTIFLLLLLTLSVCAFAQHSVPASPAELDSITMRGRLLAAYDAAVWHASDAVVAIHPAEENLKYYVARKVGNGWEAAFGQLTEQGDAFKIAYLATQGKDSATFSVQTFDPARSDTGWYLSAVKAIETAKHHFSGAKRPYNVAVLPADAGQFYVYLVPAQTDADSYPLGGDARFLISSNGDSIVGTRQLHKSIIEFSTKESEEKKIEAGFHTAVLDDVPEDTDVFHVLARRPHVKEWVVAPTYVYVIDPDGEIRYVAPTRVFLKAQSKWQSHRISPQSIHPIHAHSHSRPLFLLDS